MRDATTLARDTVEAFNAGDWDRLSTVLAADCVFEELATGRRLEGRDQTIEVLAAWKRGFPDARGTITNVIASGDHVAQEITWEGTHAGPLETPFGIMPASGRRVLLPAVQVTNTREGRIQEVRHVFDLMGLLNQLGVSDDAVAAAVGPASAGGP